MLQSGNDQNNTIICGEFEQIYSGLDVLKKTKAFQQKQNEIQNANSYIIKYQKKNVAQQQVSMNNVQHIVAEAYSVFNKNLQYKPNNSIEIDLDAQNKRFTIGKLEREIVNLDNDRQAIVIFNRVECPKEEMMSSIHLLVDYSNVICIMSLDDHCKQFIQQFSSQKSQNIISFKTIEQIAKFLYQNKQKIRIQDISQMRGYPTLIQITRNCENQILEDNQIFRVGYQPQLIVRKIYPKFENFLLRYSQKPNLDDMVFEALQQLQSKVQFSGIDDSVSELFMHIQDRSINKSDYLDQLENENLMIQSKLYSALEKHCILLQTQRDENQIEHFLLVADQKTTFCFGRMEFSDISFQSTQVSRNHGTIEYRCDINKWIIMDGQQSLDTWKNSSFGVWLEMKPKTFYFIDPDQTIKVGQTNIKLTTKNLYIDLEDVDEAFQLGKFAKSREQEVKELKDTLFNL